MLTQAEFEGHVETYRINEAEIANLVQREVLLGDHEPRLPDIVPDMAAVDQWGGDHDAWLRGTQDLAGAKSKLVQENERIARLLRAHLPLGVAYLCGDHAIRIRRYYDDYTLQFVDASTAASLMEDQDAE